MGKVSIAGRVVKIITDRTRFKNYSPEVEFDNLYVTFRVPEDEISITGDSYIITQNGFCTYVLDAWAESMDEMHRKWEQRDAKRQEEDQKKAMRGGK